jgi:hypothetical protein
MSTVLDQMNMFEVAANMSKTSPLTADDDQKNCNQNIEVLSCFGSIAEAETISSCHRFKD